MGSIVIAIPDIPNANLIYDENETRAIFRFFWSESGTTIDGLNVTDAVRAFAQTLLVAAIDGSYAIGYVAATFDVIRHGITRPNASMVPLASRA